MRGRTQYRWLKSTLYDDGRVQRLRCKVLGPNLARYADFMFALLNVPLVFFFLILWGECGWHPYVGLLWLGHFILYSVLQWLGFHRWIARKLFGHRLDFVISPEFIKVGGWFGYKTSPNQLLNFTNADHPKAEKEVEEEQRKGKRFRPYYRKTRQIIMYNGEIPTVLASVYNSDNVVTAILIRLQAMQETMKQLQMQSGSR